MLHAFHETQGCFQKYLINILFRKRNITLFCFYKVRLNYYLTVFREDPKLTQNKTTEARQRKVSCSNIGPIFSVSHLEAKRFEPAIALYRL